MRKKPLTTARKTPRQERSQATVTAILDATARVLVQTGYDRASTNRIAVAAGVSVGSLYQYFPSKEAIVAALVERHISEMNAVIRGKLVELANEDLRTAVREMVRAMLDAHLVDPKLHKVLMEQVPRTGRLERVLGVEKEMTALVGAYLAARKRELRCKDLEVAAFLLVNTVEGVTHAATLHHAGEVAIDGLARELTDMIMRYIAA
jgi:AcrR family transcriptional regulator